MPSSAKPQSSRVSLNPNSGDISRVQSMSDTQSIASQKSNSGHRVRASIEGALDKLRSHGSSSQSTEDDPEGHERRRLEKLLPKRVVSKRRRKKQQQQEEQQAKEAASRGRSIAERGTLEADGSTRSITTNTENSSLLTYESDDDVDTNIPPPLASHPSHIGYLTTSSPLVKSASHIDAKDIVSAASTVPSTSQLNVGDTDVQKYKVASLQAPAEVGERRPTSPVDKLKGAFGRRSTSPNSKAGSGSPERKPLPSPVQAARQQDGDTTKRRGSVAARIGAIFPDRAASPQQMEKPKARIPTITTSSERPHTPPTTAANAAPAIVNTPPTPTEISSPTFNGRSPIQNNPNIVTSPSGNMISHRRTRSGTNGSGNHPLMPSKLSSMQSAPLTPTPENGAITGGSQQQQSGFFSSVFSAAQNAANTLSNTITSTNLPGQNRIRSGTQDGGEPITKPMDGVEVESAEDARIRSDSEAKEPAVKTLGMGDLSLDQLGISETPQSNVTPVTANFSEAYIPRGRSATVGAADDFERSYQVPGTAVISDKGEATNNVAVMDDTPMSRTFSAGTYETSIAGAGDASPRNGSVLDGKTGRSNSIRSALGAPRRHRGSSVATNTTVGGGLRASLPGGVAAGTTPKVTGFAVASKKRNRDFHQLFRSVPDDDYLIEDYSCALQREILAHGRLYVSEGHLCFSSNIFGWVTTLVMSFDEIVSVEKRNTALLFKNGLIISTLHSKNVFASFTSRDSTYDLIVGIWKLGHPSLRSSLNGVRLEETGGGDKTEKDDPSESGSDSDPASGDEEVYDEDEEYDEEGSLLEEGSFTASEPLEKTTTTNRKVSAMTTKTTATSATKKDDATGAPAEKDYPGPPTHAPTECADGESHYEKVIADEVINAPLGKIYNLMFGPASTVWLSNWLTNDMKCLELTMEEKRGLTKDNVTRLYSYIKPLYASIGPKSTKCITTETLDMLDLDKAVSVTVSTQTPDVPSGNVFLTKTKYCLTWAEGGGTRIQMNCTIEWTGKSWLKGPIEKGANDGQVTYAKEIVVALKKAVGSSRAGGSGATAGGGRKGRKGKKSGSPKAAAKPVAVVEKTDDWGVLEPIHGLLGPVVDIFKPLLSGNMVYGLLVGLLVATWFGYGRGGAARGDVGMGWSSADRVAAYEEIWRREEGQLWEWLEARIGMQGVGSVTGGLEGLGAREASEDVRRGIEERLKGAMADEVNVEEAIKVTEEKLRTLKSVVDKRKNKANPAAGAGKSATKQAEKEGPDANIKKVKSESVKAKEEL